MLIFAPYGRDINCIDITPHNRDIDKYKHQRKVNIIK